MVLHVKGSSRVELEYQHVVYRTEDGGVLLIFNLRTRAQDGAKVVVVDPLVVGHHEFPPPLLSRLALHLILVDGSGGVEVGEILLQVLVDLIVVLGQPQRRALDFAENGPVRLKVLDSWKPGRLVSEISKV